MSLKKNRWFLLVVVLLLAGLALAACNPQPTEETTEEEAAPAEEEAAPAEEEAAPAEEEAAPAEEAMATCADNPGEGDTITLYQQAGLTGALASILGPGFVNGTQDAVADVNASGGVCGAELEIVLTDTEYVGEKELEAYEAVRANDPIVVFTYASDATIILKDVVVEDQTVNIAAGLNSEAAYFPPDGYTVLVAPIYSDQFAGFVQFVSENWDDIKPEGAGDEPVVGVIGWASAFGAGATTPEALAYAESIGVTVLPLEQQEISGTADVGPQVQSLMVQGANVIYIQSLGFGSAQAIGAIRQAGVWDQVVVGGVNWSFNQDVLNVLGENAALANGYYGVMPYNWWTDDIPELEPIKAAFAAGGYPETDRAVNYILSYAGVDAVVQAMKHAVDLYGYENLDGEHLLMSFEDLGIVKGSGVLTINAANGDRAPREAQIRQWQFNEDGTVDWVVIQDFTELPDTRPTEAPE